MLSAGWRFGHTDTIDTVVDMFRAWMNGSISRCLINGSITLNIVVQLIKLGYMHMYCNYTYVHVSD